MKGWSFLSLDVLQAGREFSVTTQHTENGRSEMMWPWYRALEGGSGYQSPQRHSVWRGAKIFGQ